MTTNNRLKRGGSFWLIVLVAMQLLFLTGIVLYHYSALWVGKEIRLQTVPVDPRDQLYGDYVQLNYKINNADWSKWKAEGRKAERGDNVYVLLQETGTGGLYEMQGVYRSKPAHKSGEVVLRGRVQYTTDQTIRIHYGLEQYYVAENTGQSLEERARSGDLVIDVKAAPWGSVVIERIEP
ncbi:GDYXXLXY domain-containing protein [Paenibacillus albus]|uniref:GDYXXLXY domain-containing protein n=1 Tax=Paenibacillus albus TaxID=2495582 RepID=A0A3S9A379_9BACL|nr:GDYXXLXY domain-containing protein [Paenibacillus albus]AZN40189.1 hypothetical protein EJC50_11400 [Paenibacillus albus]